MDAYEIKVVDLLDLRKVIVGHGAKGQERFLDKIVVKTSDKNDVKESTFSFGRYEVYCGSFISQQTHMCWAL